jgi:cell wall-associated NlpC family hydrolase
MHLLKTTAARITAGFLLVSTLTAPAFAVSGTVNSGSSSLRIRSEANSDSAILAQLDNGVKVDVLSSAENGWYHIAYGNINGYVASDYLIVDGAGEAVTAVASASPTTVESVTPVVQPVSSKYGKVIASSLYVRSGPGTEYDAVSSLQQGKIVTVKGIVNGWYQIENGYVSSDLGALVAAPAATRSSKGQEIANYAKTLVGSPYVYGGSSPSGFDCSGFTSYVYKQFGYSINRTASTQLDNGKAVSKSELQPGDLVMFKKGSGSSRASHVGIYIGNNQFVHASTARVGVIISSMSESYYATGFVGARRII